MPKFTTRPSLARITLITAGAVALAAGGVAALVLLPDRSYASDLQRAYEGSGMTMEQADSMTRESVAADRERRAGECDLLSSGVTSTMALRTVARPVPSQADVDRAALRAKALASIEPPSRWSDTHAQLAKRAAAHAEFLAAQRTATLRARVLLTSNAAMLSSDAAVSQLLLNDPAYVRDAATAKRLAASPELAPSSQDVPTMAFLVQGEAFDFLTRAGTADAKLYGISLDATGAPATMSASMLASKRALCADL